MARYLNPMGEAINCGAELIADWYRNVLLHQNTLDEVEEIEAPPGPLPIAERDDRLTP